MNTWVIKAKIAENRCVVYANLVTVCDKELLTMVIGEDAEERCSTQKKSVPEVRLSDSSVTYLSKTLYEER